MIQFMYKIVIEWKVSIVGTIETSQSVLLKEVSSGTCI